MQAEVSFEKPAKLEKRRGLKQDYAPALNLGSSDGMLRRVWQHSSGAGWCLFNVPFYKGSLAGIHRQVVRNHVLYFESVIPSNDGREAARPAPFVLLKFRRRNFRVIGLFGYGLILVGASRGSSPLNLKLETLNLKLEN